MVQYFLDYGLFFAKTFTFLIGFLLLIIALVGVFSRGKGEQRPKDRLKISKLNDKFDGLRDKMNHAVMHKSVIKQLLKQEKHDKKSRKKLAKSKQSSDRKRIFVLQFQGDIKASAVSALREEITALLTVITHRDEVVVNIESPGGMVHAYGLAASQLQRIRDRKIPLIATIDKVAASGGYMMACVADRILAAPFAIVGSIGVVAQIPNFHRFLKKHNVDFEQVTAGEYKRTLTVFGENTSKGRKKFQETIDDTQDLFKEFVATNRPSVDIDKIATGEHWHAKQALEFKLVDELTTSDDYLLNASEKADIYAVRYAMKRSVIEKLTSSVQSSLSTALSWIT